MLPSADVAGTIRDLLHAQWAVTHVRIDNESHLHSHVSANAQTHFKVVLVSQDFEGMPRVKRHQAVYQQLQTLLDQGLHALALHLYSEREWAARRACAPSSPRCQGGSKQPQASAQEALV